jgi:shikimate dehydrogenase
MGIQPDLIINATPVGMWPNVRKSPWPPNVPLPVGAALYDLVYNPAETAFLGQGRRAGLACRSGAGMLAAQAALSFEHWTGIWPPLPEMAAALEGALRKKTKGAV